MTLSKAISMGWYDCHSNDVTVVDTYICFSRYQVILKQFIYISQMKKLISLLSKIIQPSSRTRI